VIFAQRCWESKERKKSLSRICPQVCCCQLKFCWFKVISVTEGHITAKLYNRLLLNRIQDPLEKILRINQAGFCPGHGCVKQIHLSCRILDGVRDQNLPFVSTSVDFRHTGRVPYTLPLRCSRQCLYRNLSFILWHQVISSPRWLNVKWKSKHVSCKETTWLLFFCHCTRLGTLQVWQWRTRLHYGLGDHNDIPQRRSATLTLPITSRRILTKSPKSTGLAWPDS